MSPVHPPSERPVAGGEPPDGTDPPRLTVAAVARRLGVAPATLRTWDRRYGLGPGDHVAGAHRRYGPADVARLEVMQQSLLQGASPADAARHAHAVTAALPRTPAAPAAPAADPAGPGDEAGRDDAGPDDAGRSDPGRDDTGPDDGAGPGDEPVRPTEPVGGRAGEPDEPAGPVERRGGPAAGRVRIGGRPLRLAGAPRAASGLARAVVGLDAVAARALLLECVRRDGVITTWDSVVRPVLQAVAEAWQATGAGIEVEHVLSECVVGLMGQVVAESPPPRNPRPVLLACVPEDRHSLPLTVLAAVLAERGVGSRLLGAALPAEALAAAVRRTAPAAVLLWAQIPRETNLDLVRSMPRTRPAGRVLVGGPGWPAGALPAPVRLLTSLEEAIDVLTAAAAGPPGPPP